MASSRSASRAISPSAHHQSSVSASSSSSPSTTTETAPFQLAPWSHFRGPLLFAHPANIQDRDAAGPLLSVSRRFWPFVQTAFADSAYDAERVATATDVALEIVRKHPDQVGFAVQPRRWVVERFFAWINRNRRLAKDVEATIPSAVAFLYAASVMLITRRLARAS